MEIKVTLKFPTLEFIKNHNIHPNKNDKFFGYEDYDVFEWKIFEIPGSSIYCSITYNEDNNGMLYLDMHCDGYTDHFVPKGFGKTYPVTKKGYAELQEVANREVNKMMASVLETNDYFSTFWEDGAD